MQGLSHLDLILLAVIGLGIWRGMSTGATRQVVGAVGLVVAFWVGAVLMEPAGHLVVESVGLSPRIAPVAGFIVVFSGVLAALAGVTHFARKALDSLRMGFVDKGLGGILGGIRAALVLSVLLLVLGGAALPGSDRLIGGEEGAQRSILYEPVRSLAPTLWEGFRALAPGWQDQLLDKFQSLVKR